MGKERKYTSEAQLVKCKTPPAIEDMLGHVYGWLTVLRFAGRAPTINKKTGAAYVMCECKCGKLVLGGYSHIKNGKWVSCGCKKAAMHPRFKHGLAGKGDKLYNTWKGINKRCFTTGDSAYYRYGAVGITVCGGWRGSDGFANFKRDIGEPPSKEHSIDRVDGNGNYSCGHCYECIKNKWAANCRWADRFTQAKNKKSNRYVVISGEKMTFTDAENKIGLNNGAISSRIDRGWDLIKAATTPSRYSQRTRANMSRMIIGWEFKDGAPFKVINDFVRIWNKYKPTPTYISKREAKKVSCQKHILKKL